MHFADFAGGAFALGSFVDESLDFVDDRFEFRRRYWTLLARFQQALQNFLAVESFAAAVFLDHHVRNFVDALVSGETAPALQAFAAAANQIAGAAFARVDHFVVDVRAERALHCDESPLPGSLP